MYIKAHLVHLPSDRLPELSASFLRAFVIQFDNIFDFLHQVWSTVVGGCTTGSQHLLNSLSEPTMSLHQNIRPTLLIILPFHQHPSSPSSASSCFCYELLSQAGWMIALHTPQGSLACNISHIDTASLGWPPVKNHRVFYKILFVILEWFHHCTLFYSSIFCQNTCSRLVLLISRLFSL